MEQYRLYYELNHASVLLQNELAQMKQSHCSGYKHIDLSNTDVKNIAIYYLQNDLSYDNKKMLSLKHTLRYDVNDDSCQRAS